MEQENDIMRRLVDGNGMFRRTVDPCLMRKQADRHEPYIAVLACSDARVDPAKVFNLSYGSAFVVRNAGNSAADALALGSLEYAVSNLGVATIVVLGHTGCCVVKASLGCEFPDCVAPARADMDAARSALKGLDAKNTTLIAEGNVRIQLRRLLDSSHTIRDAVADDELKLIGAMFDLSSGLVRFL